MWARICNLLLPLVVYTLAALFITWPLVTQLSTHTAGAGYGDSFEYLRLGWWGKYALQNGLDPFYQSLFAYPDGFYSAVQWAQPLIYWPAAILGLLFDPAAAFNLWILLEIILSGLTAYWLCREVTGVDLAALFGGLIFMAFPAVQGHLSAGHVNPLSNYALPVVALCLFRIIERHGGLRTALLGAFALLILALGNFTFPVFTLLPLVLFGGGYYLLFRRDWLFRRESLRHLAILFGGGALLMIPFYIPLFADLTTSNRPAYLQETGWVRYSTDPLGFVAPSPFTPWTAPIAPAFSRTVLGTNSLEGTAYLGIVAVALALIALWRQRRAALPWLVIALGCMVFSLGPLLKWQDQPVTYKLGSEYQSYVVLPWALFQNLPLISATRTPGRFNITTGLALGVLAAIGLASLLNPHPKPLLHQEGRASDPHRAGEWGETLVRPVVITGILIVLTLLEYQLFFPFPTTPAALPAYFESLAKRADVRAVFDVPADDLLAQKAALYQQTVHHKPLIAGYISRRTPVDPAKLTLLSDVATGKLPLFSPALSADNVRAILKDNGVDMVVYHWTLLDRAKVTAFATQAFGPPVYQDDQRAIFEVPKAAQPLNNTLMTLSSTGWWTNKVDNSFWTTGDASLYLYTTARVDQQWSLDVTSMAGPQWLRLSVDGQLIRSWLVDTGTINFWLSLGPGFHTLQLMQDNCTTVPVSLMCKSASCAMPNGEYICLGVGFRQIITGDAGLMAFQPHHVQLSQGMALKGFRADSGAGGPIRVETTWVATQKLVGDYHLFVHVLDQNGNLVGQADSVPGGGTFPTAQWAVPQTWGESFTIPASASWPPGKYGLYAGWYLYPDMTRLSVEGNGPRAQDGLVFLREVEIR